jgi:hypothetical protein
MATRMQQRRGTATQWTTADPILAPGEIGFESDTNQFKIGDGINHWSDLSYFKNLEDLGGSLDDYVLLSTKGQAGGVASLDENGVLPSAQIPLIVGLDTEITTAVNNAITSLVDGAPTALNTLNELAAAVNDNENFAATVVSALDLKAPLASPTFTGTVSGVTKSHVGLGNVDNTTDLNKPISTAMQTALDLKAPIASPTFTGTVSGITKSMVGLENVNNTADEDKPVSSATQDALDLKQDRITGVSDAEIGYLSGVTSDIQSQINDVAGDFSAHASDTSDVHGIADTSLLATKSYADSAVSTHDADTTNVHGIVDTAALATKTYADGAVSTAVAALTKSSVGLGNVDNTSDANKPISNATQSELDGKAPLASPTFTGTVAGITKSMVGLANVDNTSDADKPVSSATQTALDAKLASATAASTYAPLASPTFTGTVTLPTGTVTSGVILNDTIVNADINTAAAIDWTKLAISSTVSATELGYVDGVTSAIQTQLDSKLSKSGGTMTGALTLSGAPTSDLHAATKLYVDNVTAGINFHESVHVASTTNSGVIYNNGTAGVGATLTADTNRSISALDGESVVVGERILMKNQTDAKQNGIYVLTDAGSGSTPWVMTRATDSDNNPTGEMKNGDFTFVQRGTLNASIGYINNSTASPIVIGTDNITYTEFNAGKTVVAGNGLTEATPGTFAIDTAVTQTRVANVSDTEIGYLDGVTSAIQTQLNAKTPELYTFTTTTGTAKTIATADAFKSLKFTDAGAITVTIPTHASDAIPVGTYVELYQWGGQITVAAATPATTSIRSTDSQTKSRTTYSAMVLVKVADNEWLLTGDLTA